MSDKPTTAREAMRATHASDASKVMGPAAVPDVPQVVFYRLSRKFVDESQSVPDQTGDILYYTLSVGHHTGVMDCFDEVLACSYSTYEHICTLFPEGDARYKMEGILRSGEIQIDKTNVGQLYKPLDDVLSRAQANDIDTYTWLDAFRRELNAIQENATVYLMGRRRG